MKKIFLLFTILLSFSTFAQNLTLSDVLAIKKMDLGDADEFLSKKGWEYLSVDEYENYNTVGYTYNKSYFEDKAESFFYYSYSTIFDRKMIGIQIHKKEKLNSYINQIKAWGGKLINSYVEDGVVIKIYQGSTMTYIIKTSSQTNDYDARQPIYYITIMSNEEYFDSNN
ncbi:hypothetical protein ACTS9U_07025 [Empedobacter falsenii]